MTDCAMRSGHPSTGVILDIEIAWLSRGLHLIILDHSHGAITVALMIAI